MGLSSISNSYYNLPKIFDDIVEDDIDENAASDIIGEDFKLR